MNIILLIINFLFFNLNTHAYELQVINYGIYDSNGEHLKKTNTIKSSLDNKKFGFCFQFEVNEVVDKVTMNFGYYDGGFRESYPRYVLVNEKLAKGCYLKEINKIDFLKKSISLSIDRGNNQLIDMEFLLVD